MHIDYSKPVWDPRLNELDILIAEDNRRKNRVRKGTEQTEAQIETRRPPQIPNSPDRIANRLNADGVPSRSGKV